jgi:uncharacterized protein (TIGR04222 family)
MNPFDLPGPQFLVLYLILGVLVTIGLALFRISQESGTAARVTLSDPYLIAYLRGGANEALRVATVSLLDRGLLSVKGAKLVTDKESGIDLVRAPIEKALLKTFKTADAATAIFGESSLEAVCLPYEQTLVQMGLMPNETIKAAREKRFFIGLVVLGGVALIKILIALNRGRHNIGFLILLAIGFAFVCYKVSFPPRTRQGDALLADLKTLFASLQSRASGLRSGGATDELVLLAAVFGLGALSTTKFPYDIRALYPRAVSSSSSTCGTSCGSSCGGSSGCGGGGGCGGGCGGCGG